MMSYVIVNDFLSVLPLYDKGENDELCNCKRLFKKCLRFSACRIAYRLHVSLYPNIKKSKSFEQKIFINKIFFNDNHFLKYTNNCKNPRISTLFCTTGRQVRRRAPKKMRPPPAAAPVPFCFRPQSTARTRKRPSRMKRTACTRSAIYSCRRRTL